MPRGTTNAAAATPQPAPTPTSAGAVGDAQAAAAALASGNRTRSSYESSGLTEANSGAGNVTSVAPNASTVATGMAPVGGDSRSRNPVAGPQGAAATSGAGAWNGNWEARFTKLKLAPADMDFLRRSGFDAATLEEAATELEKAPIIDSGQVPTAASPTGPETGASTGAGSATAPSSAGATAWNETWARKFADVLTRAGASKEQVATELRAAASQPRTEAELQQIFGEMQAAAAGGAGASTGTGGVDPATGAAAPAGPSAWNDAWAKKFSVLMTKMGATPQEIDAQLKAVKGQPMPEAQLQQVYTQMEQSLGAWDDGWKKKFQGLFDEIKVPKEQQSQAFAGLAGQGLDGAALQKAYDQMSATKPGWNKEWEDRFATLALPAELTKQLKDSGAPVKALQQQFDKLISTKMEYSNDGRLKKLKDAGASSEEQWGVMLNGTKGEDFNKLVEQIHSGNVPLWKRGLSMAVNLIPGVGTLQYAFGKDFITGEKIDRSNPLNIGMAILSAIPVATSIRGGLQAVKGAGMLTTAIKAGTAGSATVDALKGAGMMTKFTTGLTFADKLRVATPIVNRFGDAAKMYSAGRGFYQGSQFLAAAAATKTLADGSKVIDKGLKGQVFAGLEQGKSIQGATDGLRTASRNGEYAFDIASKQGSSLSKIADETAFLQKAGHVNRFNPFSNKAGIQASVEVGTGGTTYTKLALGANFKPGSLAGIAQVRGSVAASNISAMTMQKLAGVEATLRGAAAAGHPIADDAAQIMIQNASKADEAMKGLQDGAILGAHLNPEVVKRIGLQGASIAEWGKRLGVGQGGSFRSLLQMSESSRAVKGLISAAGRSDSAWANGARSAGGWAARNVAAPTAGMLTFGVLSGQTGKMTQPFWEMFKNRESIAREQKVLDQQAAKEQQQLQAQYAEMQARGGGVDPNASAGAAGPVPGVDAGSATGAGTANPYEGKNEPGVTAPAGGGAGTANGQGGVHVDPATGWYVDEASGLMADPKTGTVVDPKTGQVVGQMGAPEAGTPAAQQAAANPGAAQAQQPAA